MTIISIQGLAKSYGPIRAVAGIDLDIAQGEIFGLLGPNGAGKTTTIGMLCTIVRPTAGRAIIAGCDVVRAPAQVRRRVGIVFQDPTLDTILTGRENLELHGRLYGIPRKLRRQRIDELLAFVELAHRADDLTRTYSGGMRRRLELARGLMHRPAVLFLDEPTLGLDPQTRARTWEYIQKMARDEKTTVVLTTHYMEEAEQVCHRVGIIDRGRIIALGTPAELKETLEGYRVIIRMAAPPLAAIRALPYVSEVECRGGLVEVTLREAHRHLPELLAGLSGLESVETRMPTLNDVFIKLTGRDIRDENGEDAGGWMESLQRYQSRQVSK